MVEKNQSTLSEKNKEFKEAIKETAFKPITNAEKMQMWEKRIQAVRRIQEADSAHSTRDELYNARVKNLTVGNPYLGTKTRHHPEVVKQSNGIIEQSDKALSAYKEALVELANVKEMAQTKGEKDKLAIYIKDVEKKMSVLLDKDIEFAKQRVKEIEQEKETKLSSYVKDSVIIKDLDKEIAEGLRSIKAAEQKKAEALAFAKAPIATNNLSPEKELPQWGKFVQVADELSERRDAVSSKRSENLKQGQTSQSPDIVGQTKKIAEHSNAAVSMYKKALYELANVGRQAATNEEKSTTADNVALVEKKMAELLDKDIESALELLKVKENEREQYIKSGYKIDSLLINGINNEIANALKDVKAAEQNKSEALAYAKNPVDIEQEQPDTVITEAAQKQPVIAEMPQQQEIKQQIEKQEVNPNENVQHKDGVVEKLPQQADPAEKITQQEQNVVEKTQQQAALPPKELQPWEISAKKADNFVRQVDSLIAKKTEEQKQGKSRTHPVMTEIAKQIGEASNNAVTSYKTALIELAKTKTQAKTPDEKEQLSMNAANVEKRLTDFLDKNVAYRKNGVIELKQEKKARLDQGYVPTSGTIKALDKEIATAEKFVSYEEQKKTTLLTFAQNPLKGPEKQVAKTVQQPKAPAKNKSKQKIPTRKQRDIGRGGH